MSWAAERAACRYWADRGQGWHLTPERLGWAFSYGTVPRGLTRRVQPAGSGTRPLSYRRGICFLLPGRRRMLVAYKL